MEGGKRDAPVPPGDAGEQHADAPLVPPHRRGLERMARQDRDAERVRCRRDMPVRIVLPRGTFELPGEAVADLDDDHDVGPDLVQPRP